MFGYMTEIDSVEMVEEQIVEAKGVYDSYCIIYLSIVEAQGV